MIGLSVTQGHGKKVKKVHIHDYIVIFEGEKNLFLNFQSRNTTKSKLSLYSQNKHIFNISYETFC